MRSLTIFGALALCATAIGQVPLPPQTSTYTSNRARGTFFTAPTQFVVTHLQVPDDRGHGFQSVALYKLKAAPPAFSATINVTPLFFAGSVPSDQYIPVVPPVVFQQGEVLATLGVTHPQNATTYTSSYGGSKFSSSVLGQPVTLERCGTQDDFVKLQGKVTMWSEVNGSNGRVRIFIGGQGDARFYGTATGSGTLPSLLPSDPFPPLIGNKAEMELTAGATNLAGVLLLSGGRLNVPVAPFGTLLVQLPLLGSFVVPGPVSTSSPTPISFPLPNTQSLIGVQANWQTLMIRSASSFAMTNGLEWKIGR